MLLLAVIGDVEQLLSVIGISSALVDFQLYTEKTVAFTIKDGARLIRIISDYMRLFIITINNLRK